MTHAPPTSAIGRALADPDAWITGSMQMLREIEHGLRVLGWMQTEDATKPKSLQRDYPTRIPLTVADRKAAEAASGPIYDSLPIEEMADFLGWARPEPKEA